jgi:F-type H+-transporting ATPase subunit b
MNTFLLAMDLPPIITPDKGLVIWTLVVFVLVLIVLRKFAWNPILSTVDERTKSIQVSLEQAEKARAEMETMQAGNVQLLNEAKEERSKMLKEAKEIGEKLIAEAKEKASIEFSAKVESASKEIENQKLAAITDVKNQAGNLAIEVAEKILRKELSDKSAQETYANTLVDEFKMN